jgi:hypothetical protein
LLPGSTLLVDFAGHAPQSAEVGADGRLVGIPGLLRGAADQMTITVTGTAAHGEHFTGDIPIPQS